jgi:hypothetical protein
LARESMIIPSPQISRMIPCGPTSMSKDAPVPLSGSDAPVRSRSLLAHVVAWPNLSH